MNEQPSKEQEVTVVCRSRYGAMKEVSRKTFMARLTPKRYALPGIAVGWTGVGTAYFYRGGPRSGKFISTDVYSSYVFRIDEAAQ